MNVDLIKKIVGIVATSVTIAIAAGSVAVKYFDAEFVSHAEYDERQMKQESLLRNVRVDAAIAVLENRRMILEERLRTLSPGDVSRARTERELQMVIQSHAEWMKQRNTPN